MSEKIENALLELDENIIAEAVTPVKKKNKAVKWASLAAACLALAMLTGLFVLKIGDGDDKIINLGGVVRNYKNNLSIQTPDTAIMWRWDQLYVWEQYTSTEYEGCEYITRASFIDEDMLGDELCELVAKGYDFYEGDAEKKRSFKAYSVKGISKELIICLDLDGAYTLFLNNEKRADDISLSRMFELADLEEHLTLGFYTKQEGRKKDAYFTLNDDTKVWQIIKSCNSAEISRDSLELHDKDCLSFTATSKSLGIYKVVFKITEDGYIWTNIFDHAHVWFIGRDAAETIYSYADKNSEKSSVEPYEYTPLAGTVVGFEEGYILIDDSVMCENPEEGIIFRVPTDMLHIRRVIEGVNIKEGDTVAVGFRGQIDAENGYVVNDPRGIAHTTIVDGVEFMTE